MAICGSTPTRCYQTDAGVGRVVAFHPPPPNFLSHRCRELQMRSYPCSLIRQFFRPLGLPSRLF